MVCEWCRWFQVRERLKKMGNLQPLNIFLKQEIDRMRKVLTIVKKTLSDLRLAIEGTIIMNEVFSLFFLTYLALYP